MGGETHPSPATGSGPSFKAGLQDEHGQFFRKQIYDWSTENSLSYGLRLVLTQICHEVMAVLHPEKAVVRLHHLARRERGGTHARDALTDLALGEARLHRLMLERLARDLVKERLWETDINLFLDYVDPDALVRMEVRTRAVIAESALRGELTSGWMSCSLGAHRKCGPRGRGMAAYGPRTRAVPRSAHRRWCAAHRRTRAHVHPRPSSARRP